MEIIILLVISLIAIIGCIFYFLKIKEYEQIENDLREIENEIRDLKIIAKNLEFNYLEYNDYMEE